MTTLIESSNKKSSSVTNASSSQRSSGPNAVAAGSSSTSNNSVLTAIEPLSLPSVVGSKPLFNNTEKTAGLYYTTFFLP